MDSSSLDGGNTGQKVCEKQPPAGRAHALRAYGSRCRPVAGRRVRAEFAVGRQAAAVAGLLPGRPAFRRRSAVTTSPPSHRVELSVWAVPAVSAAIGIRSMWLPRWPTHTGVWPPRWCRSRFRLVVPMAGNTGSCVNSGPAQPQTVTAPANFAVQSVRPRWT